MVFFFFIAVDRSGVTAVSIGVPIFLASSKLETRNKNVPGI